MKTQITITCHHARYRKNAYARVRDALVYYVDDISVGTKVSEVRDYIKHKYDIKITQKLMRDVCIHAKDYSRFDITSLLLENGKWKMVIQG